MKKIWDKELIFERYDPDKLYAPIPGLTLARERKQGYTNFPIDDKNPHFHEELVDLAAYGIAGQNYYSRPNAATGEPIPEAGRPLRVRRSLADKLSDINNSLRDPLFEDFFGGRVELYVEDAHRPPTVQKNLHDVVFPALIRRQVPEISDEELDARITRLIARPSSNNSRPSPHSTGGAVDVILRYAQDARDYVAGSEVRMGHIDGDTSERVLPDYFELHQTRTPQDLEARRNRRAFYAIMTGKVFGVDTALQVNPTEWWHWSYGDQMWAKLQGKSAAFYGEAELEP